MKKLDKLITLVLIFMIILNPILDLTTSIIIKMDINILFFGVIVRSLILVFLIIYIFFIKKIYRNKKALLILSILIIYSFLFAINIILTKENFIIQELIKYFKIVYLPILFIFVYFYNKDSEFKIEIKHILISLCLYSVLIIIPYLTDTSFLSYAHSKIGTVGWFYAANEIGNIFAICIPFAIEYIFEKEKKLKYKIIIFVLIVSSIFILGTKTPFLSLIICLFIYYINLFIKSIKEKNKLINFITITFILVFMLLIIPLTPFYKNIESHYQFQKVNNLKEILTDSKKVDHFIFGERMKFLNETKNTYKDSNFPSKLFGIGYYDKINNLEYKTIEMDFVDIYFRSGPFMFIFIYLIIPCLYLFDIQKNWKNNKETKLYYIISLIIIILISATAGHVFTAPSVSLYVIIIMIMFYNSCKAVDL